MRSRGSGNILADTDENKATFAAASGTSNSITIGGGAIARTNADGPLKVSGGYGSTGLTLVATGVLHTGGTIIVASTTGRSRGRRSDAHSAKFALRRALFDGRSSTVTPRRMSTLVLSYDRTLN